MLTGRDFLVNNLDNVEKEIEAILEWISSELGNGYLTCEWSLDYAPAGTAEYVAAKVSKTLASRGWCCEYSICEFSNSIKFSIKLNIKNLL